MTMTITFTGTALEVRYEMLELLGINTEVIKSRKEASEQTVDQQVEAAFGEVKRGRGRPRKSESALVETLIKEAPDLMEESRAQIVRDLEQQVASVSAPAVVVKTCPDGYGKITIEQPVVEEAPTPAPQPEVKEGTSVSSAPAPTNAQDLMSAAMEVVKGDSAKKIALVKLLGSYGAKTINTLAAEHYAEFWEKVQAL